ncbi:hypothetical protein CNYM01_05682 [Colletotrichum nymphaeae SA-01]|uniref:Uncharacterized protein n=1 Tax=Colletotrichum nymphaeae SA-01 TaxID=1460502 RepID=A0A135US65_9PEZI|nr:hypothetical protein CNYM01_05682 [Colletotrichum nymphaeae SA-01]
MQQELATPPTSVTCCFLALLSYPVTVTVTVTQVSWLRCSKVAAVWQVVPDSQVKVPVQQKPDQKDQLKVKKSAAAVTGLGPSPTNPRPATHQGPSPREQEPERRNGVGYAGGVCCAVYLAAVLAYAQALAVARAGLGGRDLDDDDDDDVNDSVSPATLSVLAVLSLPRQAPHYLIVDCHYCHL